MPPELIDKFSYKREYRHRKMRTHREMRISYETERYGKTYISEKCYLPFRSEGDSIEVLYNPDNPYNVRIPGDERCICSIFCLSASSAQPLVPSLSCPVRRFRYILCRRQAVCRC